VHTTAAGRKKRRWMEFSEVKACPPLSSAGRFQENHQGCLSISTLVGKVQKTKKSLETLENLTEMSVKARPNGTKATFGSQ